MLASKYRVADVAKSTRCFALLSNDDFKPRTPIFPIFRLTFTLTRHTFKCTNPSNFELMYACLLHWATVLFRFMAVPLLPFRRSSFTFRERRSKCSKFSVEKRVECDLHHKTVTTALYRPQSLVGILPYAQRRHGKWVCKMRIIVRRVVSVDVLSTLTLPTPNRK